MAASGSRSATFQACSPATASPITTGAAAAVTIERALAWPIRRRVSTLFGRLSLMLTSVPTSPPPSPIRKAPVSENGRLGARITRPSATMFFERPASLLPIFNSFTASSVSSNSSTRTG